MARKKKPQANPETDLFLGLIGLSANQIVSYNLGQARLWKNWTQEQAAEAIEPYLGVRWSKASVSQAERSVDGNFIRNFSADEIVAFAQAFEVPVTWFFMPPPPVVQSGEHAMLVARDGTNPQPLATLIDLVFGTPNQQANLTLRLQGWLQLVSAETLTEAQHRITSLTTAHVTMLLRNSFAQLRQWQTSLHNIANHLETLEADAKRAIASETGLPATELGYTLTTPGLLTGDLTANAADGTAAAPTEGMHEAARADTRRHPDAVNTDERTPGESEAGEIPSTEQRSRVKQPSSHQGEVSPQPQHKKRGSRQ